MTDPIPKRWHVWQDDLALPRELLVVHTFIHETLLAKEAHLLRSRVRSVVHLVEIYSRRDVRNA